MRYTSEGLLINVDKSTLPLVGSRRPLLRKQGVTQAWAGSFDSLLHKNTAGLNTWLAAQCGQHGPNFLMPFGSVNPKLPDWEEDLRRCHEKFRLPGIRVHPNYRDYNDF